MADPSSNNKEQSGGDPNVPSLPQAYLTMRKEIALETKKFVGLKFDKAFSGKECVDYLQTRFSLSDKQAKQIGENILQQRLISHCSSDKLPFTEACFYQFVGDDSTYSVPLVTIHGFKGCSLVDKDGNVGWITPSVAAGLSNVDLRLPLEWEFGKQKKDGWVAGELLKKVSFAGFGEEVYGPWLKTSRSLGRVHVSEFAYDWRRSLFEAVEDFIKHLEQVKKYVGKPAQIIAHSLGGLVTLGVMNQRPDLINSVLFCGVPFAPGIGFLRDLHVGESVGNNKKVLRPQVLFTFTSIWSFFTLPEMYKDLSTIDDLPRIVDKDWNTIEINFYDLQDWKKNKLGIFGFDEPSTGALDTHLANAFKEGRRFRDECLIYKKDVNYPPVGVLNADSKDTLAYIIRNGPESVRGLDFEDAKKDKGDGRLRPPDTMPPEGIKTYKVWTCKKAHSQLLSTPEIPQYLQELATEGLKVAK